jgi:hypothetical protein
VGQDGGGEPALAALIRDRMGRRRPQGHGTASDHGALPCPAAAPPVSAVLP